MENPAAAVPHRIPAVERAVDVLEGLVSGPAGIRELTARLGIPRSTVYRVLNSLEARGLVVRGEDDLYRLGPQLLRLARAVPGGFDLVALSRPLMEDLARTLCCSVKLSVLDDGMALVVATAESPETYSVTTQVGRRFPLHAGAASKVIAAFGGEAMRRLVLGGALERRTAATITDARSLDAELAEVRRRGHAIDRGEFAPGIHAVAAPVFGPEAQCVAALSIPYLEGAGERREQEILRALLPCAKLLSARLGGR
jgi:DNA-binding IclR family transcriptional regulator